MHSEFKCAWCGTPLYGLNSEGNERQSDGICNHCVEQHYPEILGKFREMKQSLIAAA